MVRRGDGIDLAHRVRVPPRIERNRRRGEFEARRHAAASKVIDAARGVDFGVGIATDTVDDERGRTGEIGGEDGTTHLIPYNTQPSPPPPPPPDRQPEET